MPPHPVFVMGGTASRDVDDTSIIDELFEK
jgi:hypothetical protein